MCTSGEFDVAALDEPYNGLHDDAVRAVCSELMSWKSEHLILMVCHVAPTSLTFDGVVRLPIQVSSTLR